MKDSILFALPIILIIGLVVGYSNIKNTESTGEASACNHSSCRKNIYKYPSNPDIQNQIDLLDTMSD